MKIDRSTALVTGANRGLGAEFVRQMLDRGVSKIYATARQLDDLGDVVALDPQRVTPLQLDITKAAQVADVAATATDVNVLVNNAGYAARGSALDADVDDARESMNVNVFGTLDVLRAFVPVLETHGSAAVVNVLSMLSLAPIKGVATYAASKAALESLTVSLRGELESRDIAVHAVYPALIDTRMAEGLDLPKAQPCDVVSAALDGVEAGDEAIAPDDTSAGLYATWLTDPRGVQSFLGAL